MKQVKRVAKTKTKLNLPVCEPDKINEFGLIMKDGVPVVYTDGACSNNGSFGSKVYFLTCLFKEYISRLVLVFIGVMIINGIFLPLLLAVQRTMLLNILL